MRWGEGAHGSRAIRTVAVGLVGIALTALSPSAQASQRVAVAPGYLGDGPYLAGERVAWRDYVCPYACLPLDEESFAGDEIARARVVTPGAKPVVLDRQLLSYGGGAESSAPTQRSFVFSGGWMTQVDQADGDGFGGGPRRLRAGRIGAPLPTVFRCVFESGLRPSSPVLDGGRMAYQREQCRMGRSPLTIRELASGSERQLAQPADARLVPVALAGPYLLTRRLVQPPAPATEKQAGLRLLEWRTGRTVVDLDDSSTLTLGAAALQRDGTVAAVSDAGDDRRHPCRERVYIATPPRFELRQVARSACGDALRISGRAVTFQAGRAPSDLFLPAQQIRRVSASGRLRVLARFGAEEATYGFDADGEHTVFGVRRCRDGYAIVRLDRDEKTYSAGSLACPVRFPVRQLQARGDRARVRVNCPRGCEGILSMDRGKRRLARGRLAITGSRVVPIALAAGGRRELRRATSVRGSLRAVVLDRGGRRHTTRARAVLNR